MFRKSLLAITLLATFSAAGAASADPFETFVGGDVEIDVDVYDVETLATGYRSKAETDIGTINEGSYIMGDVDIDVIADDVTTKATSSYAEACTSIGSVGGCKLF